MIVAAARGVFAARGLAAATTDEIAARAGISQPYVIRLFGSKRALFIAVVEDAFATLAGELGAVPRALGAERRLDVMREGYADLADRSDIALLIVQAVAVAVDDAEVRAIVQGCVRAMHKSVWSAAAGDTTRVREFFGIVMLLSVVRAIDVPELLGPDW